MAAHEPGQTRHSRAGAAVLLEQPRETLGRRRRMREREVTPEAPCPLNKELLRSCVAQSPPGRVRSVGRRESAFVAAVAVSALVVQVMSLSCPAHGGVQQNPSKNDVLCGRHRIRNPAKQLSYERVVGCAGTQRRAREPLACTDRRAHPLTVYRRQGGIPPVSFLDGDTGKICTVGITINIERRGKRQHNLHPGDWTVWCRRAAARTVPEVGRCAAPTGGRA